MQRRTTSRSPPRDPLAFDKGPPAFWPPLLRIGWSIKRDRGGSHRVLRREGWRPYFIFAFHDADEIGPRMLGRIARHTGLTPEDL